MTTATNVHSYSTPTTCFTHLYMLCEWAINYSLLSQLQRIMYESKGLLSDLDTGPAPTMSIRERFHCTTLQYTKPFCFQSVTSTIAPGYCWVTVLPLIAAQRNSKLYLDHWRQDAHHWGLMALGTSSCQCWAGLTEGSVLQWPAASEQVTITVTC